MAGEGDDLAGLGDPVLVGVLPQPQVAPDRVRGADLAVCIEIEGGEGGEAVLGRASEQFAAIIDQAVAVEVTDKQSIAGRDPPRALGEAVHVEIEMCARRVQRSQLHPGQVQVQNEGVAPAERQSEHVAGPVAEILDGPAGAPHFVLHPLFKIPPAILEPPPGLAERVGKTGIVPGPERIVGCVPGALVPGMRLRPGGLGMNIEFAEPVSIQVIDADSRIVQVGDDRVAGIIHRVEDETVEDFRAVAMLLRPLGHPAADLVIPLVPPRIPWIVPKDLLQVAELFSGSGP